jgi:hypothetical protein
MDIPRRHVLAAIGGSSLLLAGCTGPGGEPTPDGGDAGDGDGSPTPTRSADRFAGVTCPSFAGVDRTVCWHTDPDADLVLEPSTELFEPTTDGVETVTFTLRNRTGTVFTLNPYAWAVERFADGEWRHVAPDAHIEPLVDVPAGESYLWRLARETHPTPESDRSLDVVVPVETGRHAFAVDGFLGEGESPERVECVALFDVAR